MTQSVDFLHCYHVRELFAVESLKAARQLKETQRLVEIKLTVCQRLNLLVTAIFKGLISNFYNGALGIEYATVSKEAWLECLYGTRYDFTSRVLETGKTTEREIKLGAFRKEFDKGVLLFQEGADEVGIRLQGDQITPKLLGFVVQRLKVRQITNPQAGDVSACIADSMETMRQVASYVMALEVTSADTAESVFERIAQKIKYGALTPDGIYHTENYEYN